MYKIIIITTLFISNNSYAMDKMHDHNSKQHDHGSHMAVDGSKTKLDNAMYNEFVSNLIVLKWLLLMSMEWYVTFVPEVLRKHFMLTI